MDILMILGPILPYVGVIVGVAAVYLVVALLRDRARERGERR
ncbi:MAG: hypothetical protein SOU51_05370 [Collinsella sp.]|nr:hypothetical protein [Collinsella sp.]